MSAVEKLHWYFAYERLSVSTLGVSPHRHYQQTVVQHLVKYYEKDVSKTDTCTTPQQIVYSRPCPSDTKYLQTAAQSFYML